MIRKIKILFILAAAAVSTTACLDKYPEDAILTEQAMNNLSQADQVILGIYSKFKSGALYSGYLTVCPDIQADLVYAVDGYTNTYGDFWHWEILGTNSEIEAVYASLYSVIGSCNFFFDNVEKVRNTLTVDSDLDKLQAYEGEAYFARALAYSELIKMFCKAYDPQTAANELGVVLITKYYNPEPMVRSNLRKSYEFVLDDLGKAYEYLGESNYTGSNYFSKGAVCALYARVYLHMQDWDNAIKYSTEVINSTGYALSSALASTASGQNEYQYMWTNDIGREIIWKVGFTTTSRGGALGQVFLNYDYATYRPDYVPAKWVLGLYSTSTDKRYSAFFKSITTGHTHNLNWALLIKYLGNESFLAENILHTNMPKVFRLSEQYLIRAEAYCRSETNKDLSKAAKDITTLRVARYTTYGSTTLSEDNWLQTISDERVRELYMEGFRLNDLKRWGKGFERSPQQNSVKAGSVDFKIKADDPLFVWPIPQHELDSPGADIEPNESNK